VRGLVLEEHADQSAIDLTPAWRRLPRAPADTAALGAAAVELHELLFGEQVKGVGRRSSVTLEVGTGDGINVQTAHAFEPGRGAADACVPPLEADPTTPATAEEVDVSEHDFAVTGVWDHRASLVLQSMISALTTVRLGCFAIS
jgi:hypothetical protein